MNRWVVFVLLLLTYLALSANFEWRNWAIGVLVAGGILWLLPFRHKPLRLYHLPAVLWAVLRYSARLVWDTIRSGLDVVAIVFHPDLPIRPGVFAVPCMGRSKLGTALSAHSLTLAPGEMVVAIDEENTLYTHALHARTDEHGVLELDCRRCELLWKIFEYASTEGELE